MSDDMSTVVFTVYGRPAPAGSKRAVRPKGSTRTLIIDANPRAKPWQQQVAAAAMAATTTLIHGPCYLEVTFYLRRPKGHFGTGAHAHKLKTSAPTFPTTRPDCTKLLRAVEDAMTGIVWLDDAQVVSQVAFKRYGLPERCDVVVYELPATATRPDEGCLNKEVGASEQE